MVPISWVPIPRSRTVVLLPHHQQYAGHILVQWTTSLVEIFDRAWIQGADDMFVSRLYHQLHPLVSSLDYQLHLTPARFHAHARTLLGLAPVY